MGNKKTYIFVLFLIIFILLQLFVAWIKPPQMAEAWFSDIAYNLNSEFNGKMACDIPYGALWSSGIGKIFFLTHHIFYNLFGAGVFQARMVSLISGYILLFMMYRWAARHISREVALLSAVLLSVSPSWWTFLVDARQDMLHCLFAFIAFYLLSTGIRDKRYSYILTGGFIAALSVDIDFRGIEIVICALLFYLALSYRHKLIKGLMIFMAGCFTAFVIWFCLNVAPMGLSNFMRYEINPSIWGEGSYNAAKVFSELIRFARYSALASHLAKIEIIYWIVLAVIFCKYRRQYSELSRIILCWLLICFVVMSLIERTSYPAHFLIYSPFICMICGIGFRELFTHRKKIASGLFIFILIFGFAAQSARAANYCYHKYIKRDYDQERFIDGLRAAVDINKGIIGSVTNWYGFKDAQYYGGGLYLHRVQTILHEIKYAYEYDDELERSRAMMSVLKKRSIEYVLADKSLKDYLEAYFPGHILPEKNFKYVTAAEDCFMGGGAYTGHPLKTEVYRITSYES